MAMTILEWSGGALVLVLLIAATVALLRLLMPRLGIGRSRALKIVVVVFAMLGAIVVSSGAGMLVMHLSMMGCCEAR